MTQFYTRLVSYLTVAKADERGAVAIEYALLAFLVAVFLVASITAMRDAIAAVFTAVAAALT